MILHIQKNKDITQYRIREKHLVNVDLMDKTFILTFQKKHANKSGKETQYKWNFHARLPEIVNQNEFLEFLKKNKLYQPNTQSSLNL